MKRKGKRFLILSSCLTVAVACISMASCSLVVGSLEDIKNGGTGSDNPGGGSDVGGTYELNVAEYGGEEWYNNVVDSTLWKVTASIDAYAKDTLVLNADGTYELTKEMGAGPAADDRWGKPGESTVSRYTYYGTYTAASDGVTVTLSECTALAVFVSQYSTTLAQMPGMLFEIPDTGKITDLTQTAGTQGNEILAIELLYGPYIAVSGYGNCSQQVKLETTAYGTFSFIDNPPSTTPDTPDTKPGEEEPDETNSGVYEFIATQNGSITFVLNSDGTYTYTDGTLKETGSFKWNNEKVGFSLNTPDKRTISSTVEGNLVKLTYSTDGSSQSFVGSVFDMGCWAIKCGAEKLYSFASTSVSEGNTMNFDLYEGGIWEMSYSLYGYTGANYGTWSYANDALTLKYSNGTAMDVNVESDEISLNFAAGMTQTFRGTVSGLKEAIVLRAIIKDGAEKLYSFASTSVSEGNSMNFDLYEGNVWEMSYSLYGYTGAKYGTWSYDDGELKLAYANGSEMEIVVDEENSDKISFYFDNGMTQTFEGTVSGLKEVIVLRGIVKDGADKLYSFNPTSVSEGNSMNFDLYEGNVWEMSYSLYGYTGAKYGTWSYVNDELKLAYANGSEMEIVVDEENSDKISFYFSAGMTQTFEGSVSGLTAAIGGQNGGNE